MKVFILKLFFRKEIEYLHKIRCEHLSMPGAKQLKEPRLEFGLGIQHALSIFRLY